MAKSLLKNIMFGGKGAASPVGDIGLAVCRIGVGAMLAFGHGFDKIWKNGHLGPSQQFIEATDKMGFPAPIVFAWCSALTEFGAALMLAAGLLTRPAAAALAFNMAVAAFIAHKGAPMFGQAPTKEPALLYLLPFALFLFTGAGRFSIDALFRKSRPQLTS